MIRGAAAIFLPLAALTAALAAPAQAQSPLSSQLQARITAIEPKVVAWRRDIHASIPELGNREVRTAKLVADHLRALGIEVQTGVAHTGVVGLLRGRQAGTGRAAARRHGCASGHRARQPSVRIEGEGDVTTARRSA